MNKDIKLEYKTGNKKRDKFAASLDFILFKHFFKSEPARATDSLKAQAEILAAFDKLEDKS